MAKHPQNTPGVIRLGPELQAQVDERLLNGETTREVSQWLAREGHKIPWGSIARYKRVHLIPAMRLAAQLAGSPHGNRPAGGAPVAQAGQIRDLTCRLPHAESLNLLWNQQVERLLASVSKLLAGSKLDPKAHAALESVLVRSFENLGRTWMHPGYVPAATPATTTHLVVVLPAPSRHDGRVIDVAPEYDQPERTYIGCPPRG